MGTARARNEYQRFELRTGNVARRYVVVGTGVDPVTSRFSGARSTN